VTCPTAHQIVDRHRRRPEQAGDAGALVGGRFDVERAGSIGLGLVDRQVEAAP